MAAPGNLNFARALTRLDRPISKLPLWQSQSSLHTKYLGCTMYVDGNLTMILLLELETNSWFFGSQAGLELT